MFETNWFFELYFDPDKSNAQYLKDKELFDHNDIEFFYYYNTKTCFQSNKVQILMKLFFIDKQNSYIVHKVSQILQIRKKVS